LNRPFEFTPQPPLARFALWAEWLLLFAFIPALYVTVLEPVRIAKYPVFALPFAYAGIIWLLARPRRVQPAQRSWGPFLQWLTVCVIAAPILVWAIDPSLFFGFPRRAPKIYAAYMVLYPLLSVWPQEFLYRRFYFWRYETILPSRAWMIGSNALAFCMLHAIYHNWVAVVLSLLGGYFFAREYARTGSLLVVWVAHTVFGQYLFTVGLGRFFYRPL
jgi:hypothetical protein